MITRRRGRCQAELSSLDVEVIDAVETLEDVPSPEELPASVTDPAGPDLGSLFRIEDLEWNPAFPLFDTELEDLCTYISKDQSAGVEASPGASKRKISSDLKMKNIQNHSKHVTNKNAIAARINRLKKKEYVTNLEKKVSIMSTENNMLKQENCHLTKRVEELEDETRYLRAVLANESMLAQLLSRLSGMNGMKLSSSLFQGSDPNDHDYALPRKRMKVEEKETSGGVCLHVDKNHVSVEFCTKCAESASTSLKM